MHLLGISFAVMVFMLGAKKGEQKIQRSVVSENRTATLVTDAEIERFRKNQKAVARGQGKVISLRYWWESVRPGMNSAKQMFRDLRDIKPRQV